MKVLIVGGDFNDEGGRPSGYITKLIGAFRMLLGPYAVDHINGGDFQCLSQNILQPQTLHQYDIILWLTNVPNDKEKIVQDIKRIHPKCMLVTSKNNYTKSYSNNDLIARALQTKSNLLMVFEKEDGTILCTVMDPLGNGYCYQQEDVFKLANVIWNRLDQLMNFTRVGSEEIGDAITPPDMVDFFATIRDNAEMFHMLIHGANTSRFLGNASFRCEKGFPSMRTDEYIFVSKRNVDKRDLGINGFVACNPNSLVHGSTVQYYGEHKPSVDTPIQLCLYSFYREVNYIIHSHVYVNGAPFTKEKVPCGALEEVDEVMSLFPYKNLTNFAINLRGHGSLILCSNPESFDDYTYFARPSLEWEHETFG